MLPTVRIRALAPLFLLLHAPLAVAPAQPSSHAPPDSGFQFRAGGDLEIPAGAREGGVVVVRGSARVRGTVGLLVVLDGTATVQGGRVGELVVIRGRATLDDSAVVSGDVHLLDADLDAAPGARVAGRVERGVGRRMARDAFALFALLSLGILAAVVLLAVLAALVLPERLVATGQLMRAEPWHVAGAAALVWLAFPVLAALLIPTVIGLPIGLGYLVVGLPALAVAGTIVAGTWTGLLIYRQVARRDAHPAAAAALGVALFVALGRVPVLGFLVALASMGGAGAILLALARTVRAGRGPVPPVAGAE